MTVTLPRETMASRRARTIPGKHLPHLPVIARAAKVTDGMMLIHLHFDLDACLRDPCCRDICGLDADLADRAVDQWSEFTGSDADFL